MRVSKPLVINLLLASLFVLGENTRSAENAVPAIKKTWHAQVPSVKGITLGTSVQLALAALGKPVRDESSPANEDSEMGPRRDLFYRGLEVGICQPNPKKPPYVWRLIISGDAWNVHPGIKVGMKKEDVMALLGNPAHTEDQGSGRTAAWWSAFTFDANFRVLFENNKVIQISMDELWT